jgi:hypothetical protein
MTSIAFQSGFKYQLVANYHLQIRLKPMIGVDTPFIKLDAAGNLHIRRGYAWDGPSGPAIDTKNFMRGSLVHDALYQLMRDGHLPATHDNRQLADQILREECVKDGMTSLRAWWVYHGVRLGGGPAGSPRHRRIVERAP